MIRTHHQHRKIGVGRIAPYSGSVTTRRQNEAAAGGHSVINTCRCGAQRQTNRNQGHVEHGAWYAQGDQQ